MWRDDDVEHLRRLNADVEFGRYLGPPSDPAAQLERYRSEWRERGFGKWAVEELDGGRFVGRIGLSFHRVWPDDVELGWAVDPALQGRGYATEGARVALAHAFEILRAPRVVSVIHPENAPSIRVAEKLGERPHANVHDAVTGYDLVVYAIER